MLKAPTPQTITRSYIQRIRQSSITLWDYIPQDTKIDLGAQNENEGCHLRSNDILTLDYTHDFPSLSPTHKSLTLEPAGTRLNIKEPKRCDAGQKCAYDSQLKNVQFLQESKVLNLLDKVKGGARQAKVKIPKLRVVNPKENINLQMFTNLIRPLFPYWHLYDSHEACKFDQEHCTFCAVRSLSLRMNDTKREPFIIPHEILSTRNEKESESFQLSVENMFIGMATSCQKFQENVGLKIQCVSCKTLSKIDNNPILK